MDNSDVLYVDKQQRWQTDGTRGGKKTTSRDMKLQGKNPFITPLILGSSSETTLTDTVLELAYQLAC